MKIFPSKYLLNVLAERFFLHLRFSLRRFFCLKYPGDKSYLSLASKEFLKMGSVKLDCLSMSLRKDLDRLNELIDEANIEDDPLIVRSLHSEELIKYGKKEYALNFQNEIVQRILDESNVKSILRNYFGSRIKIWMRNSPILMIDDTEQRVLTNFPHGTFHCDFAMHQVTMMVFLTEVTTESTCTEVIPNTHRDLKLLYEKNPRESASFRRYVESTKKKYGTTRITGKKYTCLLFDAGNLIHRASYGNSRRMIHFNFAVSASYGYGKNIASKESLERFFHGQCKGLDEVTLG